MKIYTPVDAARKAGNKYLGVLVAAKFARYLNEFPRDHLDTGDEKLTTALLDRLAHHAVVITTKGKSYRMRKRRGAGGEP